MNQDVIYGATEIVDGIRWCYSVFYGEASIDGTRDLYPLPGLTGLRGLVANFVGIRNVDPTEIIIPSVLGGYPVTKIRSRAFSDHNSWTSVLIPEGVTEIGSSAFSGCSALTSVVIPSSVTSIGEWAFSHCSALTSVVIPSSVTEIERCAFRGCTGLTSVVISSSVTLIRDDAFEGCSGLISVEFRGAPPYIYIGRNPPFPNVTATGIYLPKYAPQWEAVLNANREWRNLKMQMSKTEGGSAEAPFFIYTIRGGKVTIDGLLRGVPAVLKIPSTIEGFPVTSIGKDVFSDCKDLTSVAIPSSVTSIGDSAFSGCSALTSVEIPSSVTSIGIYAFSGCSGLSSIEIPSSVTSIGNWAFSGCEGLKEVHISNIAAWCVITFADSLYGDSNPLSYAKNLYLNGELVTDLVIPEGVTTIVNWAFTCCSSLTSVVIPEGVTSIGDYAFRNCSALTSVVIPSSVTSIGEFAFSGCSALKIVVDEGNPNFTSQDGVLFNKEMTTLIRCPKGVVLYKIPSSVTLIGDFAFFGCESLVSVEIPSSVTSIGDDAFCNCSALTSVTIPSSVTEIGESAFDGCEGLRLVKFLGVPPSIDWNLSSYDVPFYDVTAIGTYLPEYASQWEKKIDSNGKWNGLTMQMSKGDDGLIEASFFIYAITEDRVAITGLHRGYPAVLEIPSTIEDLPVKSIGKKAFSSRLDLTSVVIPEGVTLIGNYAFSNCEGLTSVMIPSSVTLIGDWVFSNCSRLTSVVIPEGVISIGNYAFSRCSGLTSIVIPPGVTSIGSSAFEGCISLTSVTIPSSVTSIGGGAFGDCSGLTSIAIPSSVTSIGGSAFSNCSTLKIVVVEGNPNYTSQDGALFNKEMTTLIRAPGGIASYAIPPSVTSIGSSAFDGCSSLTSVVIPSSVTSIGNWAFSGCSGLTSVVIPEGVTSIGKWAFSHCSGLISVRFLGAPPSVGHYPSFNDETAIGMYSPKYASQWEAVISNGKWNGLKMEMTEDDDRTTDVSFFIYTISEGKVTITGLQVDYPEEIAIPSMIEGFPVTSIGKDAFSGCSGLTSVVISEGVTSIGDDAFSGCSELTFVVIPSSVTSIGRRVFDGCSKLKIVVDEGNPNCTSQNGALFNKEMTTLIRAPGGTASYTIPSSVISIGNYAFHGCKGLTSVVISSSVTSIDGSAFSGCSKLKIVVDEGNPNYASQDGALFNKEMITLIRGPGGVASYTIPSSVTSIGKSAFSGCSDLTSVVIPSSVTSIGDFAFYRCSGLTSVVIPSSVTSIGHCAFYRCSGLTSVAFLGAPPSVSHYSSFDAETAIGAYSPKYASQWEAEIDSNGKWNGLTMKMSTAPSFEVTLTAVGNGTVSGDGEYAEGESVKVTAVADEGWVFCGWNTEPAVMTPEHTFKMPDKAVKLTAYFAPAAAVSQAIKHHLTEHDGA